jgi:hypothetical protein
MLDRHTGDNILECLLNVTADFKIDTTKVSGATSDGGSNIVNAMKRLVGPDKHLICVNHSLHNMVKRLIAMIEKLHESLQKLYAMITHMRQSNVSMDVFRSVKNTSVSEKICILASETLS